MAEAANYLSRTVHDRLYGAAIATAGLLFITYYPSLSPNSPPAGTARRYHTSSHGHHWSLPLMAAGTTFSSSLRSRFRIPSFVRPDVLVRCRLEWAPRVLSIALTLKSLHQRPRNRTPRLQQDPGSGSMGRMLLPLLPNLPPPVARVGIRVLQHHRLYVHTSTAAPHHRACSLPCTDGVRCHLHTFSEATGFRLRERTLSFIGTGLGGGQGEACNVPPSRGQRRGNGLRVRRHSLDRLHASMTKQKTLSFVSFL
jgi:hypothetical protein